MALGGGYFLMQDKILPGNYINFVSARAGIQEPAARGNVAMGLELDWGKAVSYTHLDVYKRQGLRRSMGGIRGNG